MPKTRLLHAHAMPASAWAPLLGTRVVPPPSCSTPTARAGQTRLKHGVKKGLEVASSSVVLEILRFGGGHKRMSTCVDAARKIQNNDMI